MPLWQLLIMFGIWLGCGFAVWLNSGRLRLKFHKASRTARVLLALVCLVVSAVILLGTFAIVTDRNAPNSLRSGVAPFAIFTSVGALFVFLQCLAGILLVTILEQNVAQGRSESSTQTEQELR